MPTKERVEVTLFNDFVVVFRNQKYDLTRYLTKQLICLFELLMIQHRTEITKETMYKLLWNDSENPRSALKFSIFRLRNDLKKIPGFEDIEWIVTTKNGYQMNQDFEYLLDIDEFASYYHEIEDQREFETKDYKKALKMMKLYTGRLYTCSSKLQWMSEKAEWYRSAFATTVVRACQYLIHQENYEKMLELDYQAIIKEPFYEGLHYYYMKGLVETQEYHKALQYHDQINEVFYNELGTGLSSKFKQLYDVVDNEDGQEVSLDDIYAHLTTYKQKDGGFYCTYDMFKYVCEVSLKAAKRENKGYYLILISVKDHFAIEKQIATMNRLKDVISRSLRSSDVFSKINDTQFVLFVCCQEQDNTEIIMQRIENRFYRYFSKRQCSLTFDVMDATKNYKDVE